MSKKPQNKENLKNKPQIVDQQNQPFLKVLAKKVRNINKKLTEIADLELKENLKPEQVEKVSRKEALVEQRTRVQETAVLFKESYAENFAFYRANQLKELDVLARALAIHHSGAKLPQSERLSQLWNTVQQSSDSSKTINESIAVIGNALKDFANDRNLQKSLTSFIEAHGNDRRQEQVAVTEKQRIVAQILEQKPQIKQQIVEVVQVPVQIQPTACQVPVKAQNEVVVENVIIPAEPVQPVAKVQQQTTPLQENPQTQNQEKTNNKDQRERKEYKKHEYKDRGNYRGGNRGGNRGQNRGQNRGGNRGQNRGQNRGGNRGQNRGQRREGQGQRKNYRPKYQEKEDQRQNKQEKAQNRQNSSSDSEEERVRTFRRDQIKQLENQGFIVVGKPKPKPKDPREQRQFHDRQHGQKQKHHQNSQK